jgi:FAD-linked oxidoreductase
MNAWTNWSGYVRATPQRIAKPTTEAELAAAVREGPAPVRVVGSAHSFTPLVETNGTLVSLDAISGVVRTDANAQTATVRAGAKIHALGRPLFDAGLALKNQGDIDRQAVAGAVGTGTHGTGPTLGSLSSEVAGFRLVTASSEVIDCSANTNADVWSAGQVSFGALGVMSEITMSLRKTYKLRERNWLIPASALWHELPKLRDQHRHFEFFWFPYADDIVAKSLDETSDDAPAPGTSEQMAARGERVTNDQRVFVAGCEIARFAPSLSPVLQRLFTRAVAGASGKVRWSHEAFPSPRTVRFNEMEYALPAANGADCIREIAEAIRARKIATCFPLEFRFVKGDESWLSPFYKRDAVTISVHQYAGQDFKTLFDMSEAIFKRYGGRPHWGKMHTLGNADFEMLYPKWDEFRALRRKLDPNGRFLNSHLRHVFGEANG